MMDLKFVPGIAPDGKRPYSLLEVEQYDKAGTFKLDRDLAKISRAFEQGAELRRSAYGVSVTDSQAVRLGAWPRQRAWQSTVRPMLLKAKHELEPPALGKPKNPGEVLVRAIKNFSLYGAQVWAGQICYGSAHDVAILFQDGRVDFVGETVEELAAAKHRLEIQAANCLEGDANGFKYLIFAINKKIKQLERESLMAQASHG